MLFRIWYINADLVARWFLEINTTIYPKDCEAVFDNIHLYLRNLLCISNMPQYNFNNEKGIMKETTTSGFNANIETTRSNIIGEVAPNGHDGTKRGLKSRHAQMIALGGTIGTGKFP